MKTKHPTPLTNQILHFNLISIETCIVKSKKGDYGEVGQILGDLSDLLASGLKFGTSAPSPHLIPHSAFMITVPPKNECETMLEIQYLTTEEGLG